MSMLKKQKSQKSKGNTAQLQNGEKCGIIGIWKHN